MKAASNKLTARYDALQLRERWLVALGVLGGIILLGYSLFIDPALKTAQLAERNAAEQRTQLSSIQAQMAALQSPGMNPDVAARVEIDELKKRLGELNTRLHDMESSLVPPQQMPGLLEDMVGSQTGLRLLSLKTLPVAPLLDRKAETDEKTAAKPEIKAEAPAVGLFKHGVEIKLEGSYQDLTAYLQRLEQSKMKLLWSSVSLSADKHPKLVLTLTVYSLSLDRAWLIV
jgi:MSHA biogenesis protein MshJ